MLNRLTLLGKVNLIVAFVFLAVTAVQTVVNVKNERDQYLKLAETQTQDLTTWYFEYWFSENLLQHTQNKGYNHEN